MVYIHYSPNCLKLHDQYYHTYKENETNDDDDATPQENDDQAENETEWLDLSWPPSVKSIWQIKNNLY